MASDKNELIDENAIIELMADIIEESEREEPELDLVYHDVQERLVSLFASHIDVLFHFSRLYQLTPNIS